MKRETNLCHCDIIPRPQKQQLRTRFYPQRLNPTGTTLLKRPLLILKFFIDQRESCFYIGSVLLMKATPTEPSFDQLPGKRAAKLSRRVRGKGAGLAAHTENWVWGGGVVKYEYGHSEKFGITTFQRGLESWVFY